MKSSTSMGTQPVTVMDQVFRNDLILESIFQNVAIRELKMCRLVESKWNRLALKEIQRQHLNAGNSIMVDLYEPYVNFFRDIPENIPYLCHRFHIVSYPYVQDYESDRHRLAQLEREICETFKKQIKGIDIRNHSVLGLEEVLQTLGESLVELGVLIHCKIDYPDQLKITSDSSVKYMLPNMKSISVGAPLCSPLEDIMSECSVVLKNILSKMRPNSLEELNFNNFGRFDTAVEHLIKFNQVASLKRIALYPNPNFRKGDFLLFKNKRINLQLKQLRVHIINPCFCNNGVTGVLYDLDPEEFYQFLETQKKTLQNLNLICSIYSFPPNMIGIKTLEMRIFKDKLTINTFTINFVQSFPNLRNLSLWNTGHCWYPENWDKDEQIFSEQARCNSLRTLALPLTLPLSFGVISRVLRIFPRLSYLELHPISCEVFQTIWNSDDLADSLNILILWIASRKDNRPVYLENHLCLDHAFSGVSRQKIVSVHTEDYLDKFNLDESHDNSILRLKNLRKLHVNWVAQDEKSKNQLHTFTDFAALCIFAKMKKLEDLLVHNKLHKFSDSSTKKLKARIPMSVCLRDNYLETTMATDKVHFRYVRSLFDEEKVLELGLL